ncbi:MAG TPA: hypothetical protein VLE47_03085 [Candidatus Saccharimonadales bacterium]|nr:hypothetical protein [Candidatus Saccharimonadales bacterium]
MTTNFQQLSHFFVPTLLAILVFVLGIIVASLLTLIWKSISDFLSLEKTLSKNSNYQSLEKANQNLSLTNFVSVLLWWVTILLFSLGAVELAGFSNSNKILGSFWNFLPKFASAFAILFLGLVFSYLVYLAFLAIGTLSKLPFAKLLATVSGAVIIIFSSSVSLFALGLNQNTVMVIGLAVLTAATLAFGLGTRAQVERFLKEIRN